MIKEVKGSLILLRLNGIWMERVDPSKIGSWLLRFISATNLIIVSLGMIIQAYFAKNNVLTVTFNIALVVTTVVSLAKFYYLLKYRPVLRNILRKLEGELASKYKINEKEEKRITEAEELIKYYLRKYKMATGGAPLLITLAPLGRKLGMIFNLIPDSPVGTPEPTWTPFSLDDNYYFVYFLQGYHVWAIWAIWVGADVLFGGIAFHLSGHLNIISDRLRSWICLPSQSKSDIKIRRDFGNIVSYHVEVLKLLKDLNECVNLPHLYQSSFVAVIVCSCGMQVIKSSKEQATEGFVMCFLMMCMLSSWLVICFLGNEVITECEKVGQSIYFSEWTLLPSRERKNLILILTRCQRPVYMTIGKFFKISLPSFLDMAFLFLGNCDICLNQSLVLLSTWLDARCTKVMSVKWDGECTVHSGPVNIDDTRQHIGNKD